MKRPLRIFVSAGEESGDRHGAKIVRALSALDPSTEIRALGGPRMAEAGCDVAHDFTDMAVMWFVDVFKNLRIFVRVFERTVRDLGRWRPHVVVPIDYPGFNLRLADRAGGMDIPVVYYVSPQFWAWWRGRVARIAEVVDRMMVIFPFEVPFYRAAGVEATFVGHPVCEDLHGFRPDPRPLEAAGLPPGHDVVALLPGSRRSEVKRNLPLMLEAARRLAGERPGLRFAGSFSRPRLADLAARIAEDAPVPFHILEGRIHDLMARSRAALVCAGSATVELACLGVPMVVLYRVSAPALGLYALLNRAPHIAMVNLLAGRRAVPEFLAWRPIPGPLAEALLPLLDEGPARREQIRILDRIRKQLGAPGASTEAARIVLETARACRDRREAAGFA